jgi:hypothetical protein
MHYILCFQPPSQFQWVDTLGPMECSRGRIIATQDPVGVVNAKLNQSFFVSATVKANCQTRADHYAALAPVSLGGILI